MADPAQFDHDRLGHLLSDRLLKVPRFQRRYSWQEEHINEFWGDIERARLAGDSYFMGTVVLASDVSGDERKLIIDGQQRITTTAILLVAVRDRLRELGHLRSAQSVEDTHLSDYVLTEEQTVPKLTLNPDDHDTFSLLLEGGHNDLPKDLVAICYRLLKCKVDELAPADSEYRNLINLVTYLDKEVQVLLAVATGLAEAYVIFETLNDRGVDLTTADLLKNYLFSQAGSNGIGHAESVWTRLAGHFDKPDDFVKFLRHEYMSRRGRVTNRELYKALQADISENPSDVRRYLERLERAFHQYVALREPDDASWSAQAIEVKDSLLAFRRFGFESSMPLLIAAFSTWSHSDATRFVDIVANWSVRAWMAGTLGGGVAESAFCDAAVAVTRGEAKNSREVLVFVSEIVPNDEEFRQVFIRYGSITTTRAKYLLARLERQYVKEIGGMTESLPDWSSKSVTVEHIFAKSSKRVAFDSDDDFRRFGSIKDQLQNLTLLERSLNGSLEDKLFPEKISAYAGSAFSLTRKIAESSEWGFAESTSRAEFLARLAVEAWPQ
ncbi:DUF262 domain-containing HNH endonuclease family protein [Amycolatopsis sp. NPDC004079]|uniref:DUF262 domain-containing protein n=1 Tax=Amycolatopsis sp. NPDC004079 TaxID=3154549 RepID=UPI0033A2979E